MEVSAVPFACPPGLADSLSLSIDRDQFIMQVRVPVKVYSASYRPYL